MMQNNKFVDINMMYSYEDNPKYMKNIIRPLSLFHKSSKFYEYEQYGIDSKNKFVKRGLAICHGHNHSMKKIRKIKFINYWYYVDDWQDTFPDYIADAADTESMKYFPDDYFYCILTLHCPVITDNHKLQFIDILKNLHRILNPNGFLLITELPFLFHHFLTKEENQEIKNKIHEILDEETINKMSQHKNVQNYIVSVYIHIIHLSLVGVPFGPKTEDLKSYSKYIEMKITKRILKETGYKYIGKKGDFLVCKKI